MKSADIRQTVTQQIIRALEAGNIPWKQPWRGDPNAAGRPRNFVSKKPYSGINPLLLALHAQRRELKSQWYGTFRQWQQIGGSVKRRPDNVAPGEWGCHVVFYRPVSKTVSDPDTGKDKEDRFRVLRAYTVFSADQVEGKAVERYQVVDEPGLDNIVLPDFPAAEELIKATGADFRVGGEEASYAVPTPRGSWPNHTHGDFIHVPSRQRFCDVGSWYEAAFHELAHWTEVRIGFDDLKLGYPMGELRAEMAACFLAAELNLPPGEDLLNHVAYLQHWLTAMKADASYIFRASTEASKACDYLLSFVRKDEAQPQSEVEAA